VKIEGNWKDARRIGHIGLDRMLGYGLKYGTAFGDTHLGRVGDERAA
jgi:Domain of unknown function (DUF4260)